MPLKTFVETYIGQNYDAHAATLAPAPRPVKARRIPFFARDGYTLKQDGDAVLVFDRRAGLDVIRDVLSHPRAAVKFNVEDRGDHLRVT